MGRESSGSTSNSARLVAIERHLASFLPADLLKQFWHDGFAQTRQPTFRLNTLRLGKGSQEGTVRQLLEGFGLPYNTPVESCSYFPRAHLLPAHTSAAVHVASRAHSLVPLRSGAVYFMSLSSMLPALLLLAPAPAPAPPQQPQPHLPPQGQPRSQQQQQEPQPQPQHGQQGPLGDNAAAGSRSCVGNTSTSTSSSSGSWGAEGRPLRVLDLCAAPGGKTALLAELMGNRGTLLAVDSSWPRLQRLHFNIDRLVPELHDAEQQGELPDWPASQSLRGSKAGKAAAAASKRLWQRGCVVAAHADGAKLCVDSQGLPLPPAASPAGLRATARGSSDRRPVEEAEDVAGEGVYDRILVDAPCSGLGRLQLQRLETLAGWTAGRSDANSSGSSSGSRSHAGIVALGGVGSGEGGGHEAEAAAAAAAAAATAAEVAERLERRQRLLLLRGAELLRRGGRLVYSTCTLDPRENEAVVAWLLSRVPGMRLEVPHLATASSAGYQPCASSSGGSPSGNSQHETSSGAGGLGCNDAAGSSAHVVPLRKALETHRPGSTYAPLLDWAWWEAALANNDASIGAEDSLSVGAGWRTAAACRSREELRNQLAMCVRVAPGVTYEGFFVAQFTKE